MKLKRFLLASSLLLLSAESVAATITAVRSWRAPDNTRIVLDLSEVVRYRQITSTNKHIIIELDNTDVAVNTPSLPTHVGLIQSLQFQPDGHKQRLIIQLTDDVRPNVFLLPANDKYKPRLVIDLFDKVTMEAVPIEEEVTNETNNGRSVIVAVDAGHGGEDSGAIGASGYYEKHVTLAIAKKLVAALRKTDGFKAYLTRDDDYFIPLQNRRTIARHRYKADIFISIHADAALSPLAKGASVFALSRKGATTASSRFAQALAEKENKSDLIGGVDEAAGRDSQLTNILADMVVEGSMTQSLHMGNQILGELDGIGHLHSKHVEQAGFAVLKEPGMISVLVETGFISNPREEEKLTDPDEQQKIAQSVLKGVKQFLQRYPIQKTYFAWRKEQRSGKQKARAMREVAALPEPKPVVMTPEKLIDIPAKPKMVETSTQTLAVKDAAQLMSRSLVDNSDIRPALSDKPILVERKTPISTVNVEQKAIVKQKIITATLPNSLEDFMAGVPKDTPKTSIKTTMVQEKIESNNDNSKIKKIADAVKAKEKMTTQPKIEPKKSTVKPTKHTVVEGDSLSSIAAQYHLSVDDVKTWNHLKSDSAFLGSVLRLTEPEDNPVTIKPDQTEKATKVNDSKKTASNKDKNKDKEVMKTSDKPRVHVVKVGDSLSDLAAHYGVSQQAIRDANKFKDDNVLLGQTLKIPTP